MDVQTNHRQATTTTVTYFKRIKIHMMKMSRQLKVARVISRIS